MRSKEDFINSLSREELAIYNTYNFMYKSVEYYNKTKTKTTFIDIESDIDTTIKQLITLRDKYVCDGIKPENIHIELSNDSDEASCVLSIRTVETEEEFNARPVSASYYFGRSHEGRLKTHASIWEGATKYGYSVCDNPYQMVGNPSEGLGNFLQNEPGKKYISMHLPHWFRLPINFILQLTGTAKIGIAPHGAGIKTFRASEVSCNSVMLLWEDDLAWSYEWVHGVNCLKCKPGEEVETIEKWTQDERLYSIYCEGVKNFEKYRVNNYIQDYILPIINNA